MVYSVYSIGRIVLNHTTHSGLGVVIFDGLIPVKVVKIHRLAIGYD